MLERVGKNFKIIRTIGKGGFGQIYQGINTKTNLEVAIKLEPTEWEYQNLINECKLYHHLNKDSTVMDKGIPNVYYCSTEGEYNVLVMDLMGPSLQSLFFSTLGKFSLKTVLMLIDQMIARIEFLHNHEYVHRDVKPDNFCLGLGKTSHRIYMIDLGLAKRYISKGKHISQRQDKGLVGTSLYASLNSHQGLELSRRDDMESIGYSVMQFLRGMLPWSGIKATKRLQKQERIKQKKKNTSIETLCKGYPAEFAEYLNQSRNLGFDQKPPYKQMRAMFKELFERQGYKFDYRYDWVILAQKREKMNEMKQSKKRQKHAQQKEQKL